MSNRLDEIIAQKQREVSILQDQVRGHAHHPLTSILQGNYTRNPIKNFKQALSAPRLSVIAEIKRRSPSKGELAIIADPVALAQQYAEGQASAISVLTDQNFFSGHIHDLQAISEALASTSVAILRKDFIIDRLQVAEAVFAGADAVLLIVAALGKKTKDLLQQVEELGLQALVEVHNAAELDIALECGATIVGVNNRDLTTFVIDVKQAFNLVERIPTDIIKIAESGIAEPGLAREYHAAGFDAVLIGEALVKSADPQRFILDCKINI